MNKFLYFFVAMVIVSCSNNQSQEQLEKQKPEVALSPSGIGDNNVFKATGEVVVIFEPSPARAKSLQESKDPEFLENQRKYNAERKYLMEKVRSMGREVYFSQEDDIKINVSEKQFYVVYAAGIKGGYGVALAKLNAEPKVIAGIPTMEELEKEIQAYYGSSK